MARVAALKADLAMLEGTGGTQIKGLITYSGITTHTATTVGANGDTFQAQDVALMEGKLPDAVAAPTAWVMRKAMFAALMNRRADAVSASDGKGPFLFHPIAAAPPTPRRPSCTAPRSCARRRCRTRASKGAATNLTYILLGYFPDWIVARLGVMEFLASGPRRHGAAERPDVPARHPAHRRRPAARGEVCAVRPVGRRLMTRWLGGRVVRWLHAPCKPNYQSIQPPNHLTTTRRFPCPPHSTTSRTRPCSGPACIPADGQRHQQRHEPSTCSTPTAGASPSR